MRLQEKYPPPHKNHLLNVPKNLLKPNSRKKPENKFAEITPIFQTNMSLGPKLFFIKCYICFGNVDIVIILDNYEAKRSQDP